MGVVGAFPLASDINRRIIPAPVNEMDKSTVVSIYPKHIMERKPTIQPGFFEIKPGSYSKPSVLVVGPSSWWKEIDEHQPLLEIPHSSVVVAESICKDYLNGIFGCDMGENMPGLFWVPGNWTAEQLVKEKKHLFEEANRKQRNWFSTIVKMADALWARTNGNSLTISDDMRLAARELNLLNKQWLIDQVQTELVRCKACGHLGNPEYPVCANCKAINNPEKAKALNIQFAQ